MKDAYFMSLALKEAKKAKEKGEIPVGAIIVHKNQVLSKAYNKKEQKQSALAHAEILAIQKASYKLQNWRLLNCHIYVTLEPCLMCLGAILSARIPRLTYGCKDQKGGSIDHIFSSTSNHFLKPSQLKITSGLLEDSCSLILKDFFKQKRKEEKSIY